jgi:hypothetical protein
VKTAWRGAAAARPVVLLALALLGGCAGEPRQAESGRPKPVSTPPPAPPTAFEDIEYTWTDANTERIVGWRGDTRVLAPGEEGRRYRQKFRVDLGRLRRSVEAFGIPESWLTVRYRTEKERAKETAAVSARAAARGIVAFPRRGGGAHVDHAWVVRQGRDDVADASSRLEALARKEGHDGKREISGTMASFVQGLAYRVPPTWRVRPGKERVLTGGITLPIETLRNGWGDCDSKSLLFASLLSAAGEHDVVFLEGDRHLFVGLRLPPRPYDQVVRLRGVPYVLVELTHSWPIGRVPVKARSGLGRGLYRVIRTGRPGGA